MKPSTPKPPLSNPGTPTSNEPEEWNGKNNSKSVISSSSAAASRKRKHPLNSSVSTCSEDSEQNMGDLGEYSEFADTMVGENMTSRARTGCV